MDEDVGRELSQLLNETSLIEERLSPMCEGKFPQYSNQQDSGSLLRSRQKSQLTVAKSLEADFLFSKNDEPLLVTASAAATASGTGEELELSNSGGSFVGKEQFRDGGFEELEGNTVDDGGSREVENKSMKAEIDMIRSKSGEQPKQNPDSSRLTESAFAHEELLQVREQLSNLIQENRRLKSLHYQFKNCSYADVEGEDSTFFHEILSRTRRSLQNDDESLKLKNIFDELKVSFKFSKSGADKEVEGLDKAKFKEALQNVGCLIDEKYLDEVFKRYDLDGNELIGLEEFKCMDPILFSEIQEQTQFCMLRNDDGELKRIFLQRKGTSGTKTANSVASNGINGLNNIELQGALRDVGRCVDKEFLDDIFKQYDSDNSGSVGLEEFKCAVRRRTKLEQWTASMPIGPLVASCFAPFLLRSYAAENATSSQKDTTSTDTHTSKPEQKLNLLNDPDPLSRILSIDEEGLSTVCIGIMDGFRELLCERIMQLKESFANMKKHNIPTVADEGSKDVGKFAFSMQGGKTSDFYSGLGARVGYPNLNFLKSMELEHASTKEFTTPNYQITTYPAKEWKIVFNVDKKKEREYGRHRRSIPDWRLIMRKEKMLVQKGNEAPLTDVEVLAIILYTGPMFVLYNAVLRQWPDHILQLLDSNKFAATIHCLVSGVTKVSRRTRIPPGLVLYRGFGGLKLPEQFYKAPEGGFKGYVEWGFMSTTSDKSIAIQYTGISSGNKYPTLLEIQPAAVDHGADISQYSQFAAEVEYLWNPCSLVEGQDEESIETTKDGIINKISVRMNNNVKTQTVEELRQLKKSLHLNAFQYILNETESDISALAQARFVNSRAEEDLSVAKAGKSAEGPESKSSAISALIEKILEDCKSRFEKHKKKKPEDFIQDETYRGLVREMMETKAMAISKLRLWLEDPAQQWKDVLDMQLRTAHRTLIGFLESGIADAGEETMQASYELCKMKNLITVSIDELNDLDEPVIIQAAAEGQDWGTLKLLIDAGASVNVHSRDKSRMTAVMKAAYAGHTKTLEALLNFTNPKADVNLQTNTGETALMLAAHMGHYKAVELLVKGGAKLELYDSKNFTALMKAARTGHEQIVKFLLDQEPNLIQVFDTFIPHITPVMMAAQGGDILLFKYLLGKYDPPYDMNFRDATNQTALFYASLGGNTEIIQEICKLGAEISARDCTFMTPIMVAAKNGKTAAVLELYKIHCSQCENNLSIRSRLAIEDEILKPLREVDNDGLTVVVHAASHSNTDCVKELIKLKADVTIGLFSLCKFITKDTLQDSPLVRAVAVLVEHKAAIDIADESGKTPLELSTNLRVRAILQSKNADKWTDILMAAERGDQAELWKSELWKSNIADQNNRGESALHIAAQYGHTKVVELLINNNADLQKKDKSGKTALHAAATKGNIASLRALINAKAEVNIKDGENKSALAYSTEKCCKYLLKMLGSDNWNPLMIAAKQGIVQVQHYLDLREAILCKSVKVPMPEWFEKECELYASLVKEQKSHWKWGRHDKDRRILENKERIFAKKDQAPDGFSSVLGSLVLDEGIHTWALLVKDVSTMWAGIARGVDEKEGLGWQPSATLSQKACEYIVVVNQAGALIHNATMVKTGAPSSLKGRSDNPGAKTPYLESVIPDGGFTSGQTIEFELDTYKKTLKLKVERMLVSVVYNVDTKDVFPYVSTGKSETVELVSCVSWVSDSSAAKCDRSQDEGFQITDLVKEPDWMFKILLHRFTQESVLNIITEQIISGFDIIGRNEEQCTALHIAAGAGKVEVVRILLNARAKPDGHIEGQSSCLHFAAKSGDTRTLLELLNAKAIVEARDALQRTPLHEAVCAKKQDAVRLLITFKANFKTKDKNGLTPLEECKRKGPELSAVLTLMQDGWTPLMLAIPGGTDRVESTIDRIKTLISEGEDVKGSDRKNQTSLHIASEMGNVEVIKLLLDSKCDIGAKDQTQKTPLHLAAAHSHENAVLTLLHANADINAVISGKADSSDKSARTVLDIAGSDDCRLILQMAGANGWTPLMVAVKAGILKSFLDFREIFCCMIEKRDFPDWFIKDVGYFLNLFERYTDWTWEQRIEGLDLSQDKRTASAKSDEQPTYVVGSEVFKDGVHTWEMKVDNVGAMWAGIGRKVEAHNLLGQSIPDSPECYMLAFPSATTNRVIAVGRKAMNVKKVMSGFKSGDCIMLELDTQKHHLKMRINGILAFTAWDVDDVGVRPLVIMCRGSVTLGDKVLEKTPIPQPLSPLAEDQAKGLDNSYWKPIRKDILVSAADNPDSARLTLYEEINQSDQEQANSEGVFEQRSRVLTYVSYLLKSLATDQCLSNCSRLLDGIESINIQSQDKKTALHVAAEIGCLESVRSLLMLRADISMMDQENETPAAKARDPACKRLLKCMAKREKEGDAGNQPPVAEAENEEGDCGWTLLMIAAEAGDIRQIDCLIKNGEDIHARTFLQRTALHIAASCGKRAAVAALLDNKASIDAKDDYGQTPLHFAAKHGFANIMDLLIQENPELILSVPDYKQYSVLHYAATASGEAVRFLWKAKANLEQMVPLKGTALHLAVQRNKIDCVSALLELKANHRATENHGSALDLCTSEGCKYILKMSGAKGWTPLMVACERGAEEIRNYVLENSNVATCFKAIQEKGPFPAWFQEDVVFYTKLNPKQQKWRWGILETTLVQRSDGLQITKRSSEPDYSCALGSEVLEAGVHEWSLTVDNVRAMWVGIARGVSEDKMLACYPTLPGNDGYILAFGNDECRPVVYGCKQPKIRISPDARYSSGDKLLFQLDTHRHILRLKINGVVKVVVSNVDDIQTRPYVCMDYTESVCLVDQMSRVFNEGSAENSKEHEITGLNNALWSAESDNLLNVLLLEENISIFSQSGIECSMVKDLLSKKLKDRTESKTIDSWVSRLTVVFALRLLLEDMHLVKRDVFGVENIQTQINLKNEESDTALHIAASGDDSDTVRELLVLGADIMLKNDSKETAADKAKLNHPQGSCLNMIERMAIVQSTDTMSPGDKKDHNVEHGWTALMVAAEIGYTEQIEALLEDNQKTDGYINARNSRLRSALHVAASSGNAKAVKLLIERKANLEDSDEDGYTALCSAVKSGNVDSVRNLVMAKANLSVECKANETLLKLASDIDCVQLLREYGVDGWTPLMVAVEKGPYCIKLHLDTGENLKCLRSGSFHKGFQNMIQLYSKLRNLEETWKWGNAEEGKMEEKNLVLSEDGRKVSKENDNPDYSSVVGDVTFGTGVHRWTLEVNSVRYMWAGVSQHLTKDQLCLSPSSLNSENGCYCILFGTGSSDVRVIGDHAAEITTFSRSGFSSNQKLDFELNMYDRTLKYSVDGVLAVVVSNISGKELQPFVCMDYSESVELLACTSYAADESLSPQSIAWEDNSNYSQELDTALLKYSPHGPAINKCTNMVGGPYLSLDGHKGGLDEAIKGCCKGLGNTAPEQLIYRFNALSLLKRQLLWLGLDNWNGEATKFEKAEINKVNLEQQTALHLAVSLENVASVQALLAAGANKEVANSSGQTALHLAAQRGNERLVQALLDAQANPDAVGQNLSDNTERSCLEMATLYNPLCAAVLKRVGADGWTPLMVAAEKGGSAVEEYLLCRKYFSSVQNRESFPQNFRQEVQFYSGLSSQNSSKLEWGRIWKTGKAAVESTSNVGIDAIGVACVLGKDEFASGIYTWKVQVTDFKGQAWIGVARSSEDVTCSPQNSTSSKTAYIVYFASDGREGVVGAHQQSKPVFFDKIRSSSFASGQMVELRFDTYKNSLEMRLDGSAARIAHNIDSRNLYPYVRFEDVGSVKIVNSCFRISSPSLSAISEEQRIAGCDNSLWSSDLDHALIQCFRPEFESNYIAIPEKEEESNEHGNPAGGEEVHPFLLSIGERFISSITDVEKETSSTAFSKPSRLNASSGLHMLSRRMMTAPGSASANSKKSSRVETKESIPAGTSVSGPGQVVESTLPTLRVESAFKTFVGGAAITRFNVLVRLDCILNQITAEHRNSEKIQASIREGTDINAKNQANRTAICVAAENGRLDAVKALIAAKADIEQSVLHLAAKAGNAELVRTLVNSGADLNARNEADKTPFDLATNDECKYALKKMGAGDWTALMVAAERGDDRVEQYFYLRDCILSMTSSWTWKLHGQDIRFVDDSNSVESFGPGYCCALGSEEFVGWGIYTWELSVDIKGHKISAGIARGSWLDHPDLPLEKCECDLLAVLCSDRQFEIKPKGGIIPTMLPLAVPVSDDKFFQTLFFKLDMPNRTLEININGNSPCVSFKFGDSGCNRVRPYVCFAGPGKVTLKSQVGKLPGVFQNDVRFYSSLIKNEILWTWGAWNRDYMVLSDLEIKKLWGNPACAVGNEVFSKGVHTWKLLADREYREHITSVGVVRGMLDHYALASSPENINVEFILVFRSDGKCFHKSDQILVVSTIGEPRIWPHQAEITLKLDMHKQTLDMFMDQQVIFTVSGLDDKELRPYICIEGLGSVTLESRESSVVSSNSSMVSFKDRAVGLDNAKWLDKELDKALLELPMAEKIINYTKEDIHNLRVEVNKIGDQQLVSKLNKRTLGAIATRLNVHATFRTMLCQISEEALASDVYKKICSRTDINMVNTSGYTALHIAAENGHARAAELLIQHNAEVGAITKDGFTCLHCAASGGNKNVLESLIRERVPWESPDKDGRTFLHIAAQKGNTIALDLIVNYSATVHDAKLKSGTIHGRTVSGQEFIHDLLEAPDSSGSTLLHASAAAGHTHFVQALLKAGVNVNVVDKNDKSALAVSKEGSTKSILKRLGVGGWTPLMVAAEKGGKTFEQLVKAMDCMRCMQDRSPESGKEFPLWFQRLVCFEASLIEQTQETLWVWGGHELQSLQIADDGLKVSREQHCYTNYSAAVGSKVLEQGIHKWGVKVSNVEDIWLGICRGIEENNLLGSSPDDCENAFLLAFHNNGKMKNHGRSATIEMTYDQGFSSGQLVLFELDTFRHTFALTVDEKLAFFASDVDDRGIRPYICMSSDEIVVLDSRTSLIAGDSCPALAGTDVRNAWKWEVPPSDTVPFGSDLETMDSTGLFTRAIFDLSPASADPVSVLGSKKFGPEGKYTWSLKAMNVQDMWIGVAIGGCELRHKSPNDCENENGEKVLALAARGEHVINIYHEHVIDLRRSDFDSAFSSNQLVEVSVDVPEMWLSVRVNGVLIFVVTGVDLTGFKPYVCICRSEEVSFQQSISKEAKFTQEENTAWRWGKREMQNLILGDSVGDQESGLTITKITDSPDYSSVVGSEVLEGGIHTWTLKVENARSMWVGIARNIEEMGLEMYPGHVSGMDAYLLAFPLPTCYVDDNVLWFGKIAPSVFLPASYNGDDQNMTIRLELDTYHCCLRMFVGENDSPIVAASNVDCRGIQPYVCMDYEESVTLLKRTCKYRVNRPQAIEDEDLLKGFDNTLWRAEIDEALIKNPLADRVTNYTHTEVRAKLPTVLSDLHAQRGIDDFNPSLETLAARLNVLAMLKRLLDMPSSPSLAKHQNSKLISTVLDATACNEDGHTALHLAVAAGRTKAAQALLRLPGIESIVERESYPLPPAAGNGLRGQLLVECAAQGGDMELVRLFAQKAKDPQLRLLAAGIVVVTGWSRAVVIEQEEREGGEDGVREATRPLMATLKDSCALRGAFPCPPMRKSYFEVEVVRAGEPGTLSLGFATSQWDGKSMAGTFDGCTLGVTGRTESVPWNDNDKVGFYVDRFEGTYFFSVNGKFVKSEKAESLRTGELFPAFLGRSQTALRVNWGGSAPFALKFPEARKADFPSILSHAHEYGSESLSHATDEQRLRAAKAAYHGDIATLQELATIANLRVNDPAPRIDAYIPSGKYYLLHAACMQGHVETARLLVTKLCAKLEVEDSEGDRPLGWAAYNDQPGTARLMLELGAEIHTARRHCNDQIAAVIDSAIKSRSTTCRGTNGMR